jgi:hypothetical protein
MVLGDQLDTYIIDLRGDDKFYGIEGIASLVEKMVKTKKNLIFPLIYIYIYAYQIVITSTSCNCYSGESFFCYAYCQE